MRLFMQYLSLLMFISCFATAVVMSVAHIRSPLSDHVLDGGMGMLFATGIAGIVLAAVSGNME